MLLNQALSSIAGRPDLFAWRPSGELVRISNRMGITDIRSGKPRPFQVKLSDCLSDDWLWGDLKALQKYAAEHWAKAVPEQVGE